MTITEPCGCTWFTDPLLQLLRHRQDPERFQWPSAYCEKHTIHPPGDTQRLAPNLPRPGSLC